MRTPPFVPQGCGKHHFEWKMKPFTVDLVPRIVVGKISRKIILTDLLPFRCLHEFLSSFRNTSTARIVGKLLLLKEKA